MGFNYSWFKMGATTLPNERVFNRYFKDVDETKIRSDYMGLELTRKLGDYVRANLGGDEFLDQKERYHPVHSITNNLLVIIALLFPPAIGGFGCLAFIFVSFLSIVDAEINFPWFILYGVIIWNVSWLNARFLLNFIFKKFKGAYIDRKHQTISFTWKVKGDPKKNKFGHATFPLSDIEAFYSLQIKNDKGGSTHALCLAHKDHSTYSGAFLQCSVKDNPHSAGFCHMAWELIQRFADNTLPLPDMPNLEKFRALDPVTVAYDKKHNRPEHHWRKMHIDQQIDIEQKIEEEAHNFPFPPYGSSSGQKELTTPWLTWPIEQQYFDDEAAVPAWKKRAKVIFGQLTIGM